MVLAAAYSHELPRYDLEIGLTNYATAYYTDFCWFVEFSNSLKWMRIMKEMLRLVLKIYSVEPAESRRLLRALLDIGLIRTTTDNRVFGALKGALDGGLDIPHSDKSFTGFDKESKQLDPDVHRKHIYGGHVAAYMRVCINWVLRQIILRSCTQKVHAAVRADPSQKKSEKEPPKEHKSVYVLQVQP